MIPSGISYRLTVNCEKKLRHLRGKKAEEEEEINFPPVEKGVE
jgi:hypothetical protein